MLTNRTLTRINNRPRKVNRLPLLLVGGVSVTVSALVYVFELLPALGLLGTILAGALATLGVYKMEKAKTTIPLSYNGNLSEELTSRFAAVRGTGGSCLIWEDLAPR